MKKGSYISSEFSISFDDEINRLGAQVELFWSNEFKLYERIHPKRNVNILEIGSGPGFYLKKLIELLPEATFTSLERDPGYCVYQETLFAGEPLEKIKIINGDIEHYHDIGKFDLIVLRLLLEHVQHPEEILRKLHSFLNTGGKVIIIDNDFDNHLKTYPRIPELSDLYKAYCESQIAEGGDPYIGRRLPSLLNIAGFSGIHFGTINVHSNDVGKKLFLKSESSGIGLKLVEKGFLKNEIFERLAIKWRDMATSPDSAQVRELYYAMGTKSEVNNLSDNQSVFYDNSTNRSAQMAPELHGCAKKDLVEVVVYFFDEIERVDLGKNWHKLLNERSGCFDIGLDSLVAVNLSKWLEDEYQISTSVVDILQAPSLIEYLITACNNRDMHVGMDVGEI